MLSSPSLTPSSLPPPPPSSLGPVTLTSPVRPLRHHSHSPSQEAAKNTWKLHGFQDLAVRVQIPNLLPPGCVTPALCLIFPSWVCVGGGGSTSS